MDKAINITSLGRLLEAAAELLRIDIVIYLG
jgi:hypothetical protein